MTLIKNIFHKRVIKIPSCYPISLNIENKLCLVVGGGNVAERKVHSLLECDARVKVVSPAITDGLCELAGAGRIEHRCGEYGPEDLDGVFLVIGATDSDQVNGKVAADCFKRGLLVNVVDDPPNGNFFVPAVVRRGSLQIAISTDGKSPLLARRIREELEQMFGAEYAPLVELLGEIREEAVRSVPDEDRKKLLAGLVDRQTMSLLKERKFDRAKERILSAYHSGGSQP